MPKQTVRVGGYKRKSQYIKPHKRKGTKVKSYTQKRQTGKSGNI